MKDYTSVDLRDKTRTYPIRDVPTIGQRWWLGFKKSDRFQDKIRAVATGEKRPPTRGEWYLSGEIVEAYKAPNDLSTPYYIAKLVRVEFRYSVVE